MRGTAISVCIAACFAVAGSIACAASYDDFTRGYALNRAGDSDHAIEAFTAALAAGDLAATYVPSALYGRAAAYARKGMCPQAEVDLDNALKLRPAYLDAMILRAGVRDCQNKYEDARADFDAAIKLSPTTGLYRDRGRFYWDHAKYDSAAADFLRAVDVAPTNAYSGAQRGYALLWFAISAARTGNIDRPLFAKHVADADVDGWPEPLLDYFLGKLKPEDLFARAARGDGPIPEQQKCEADFYLGEWNLGHAVSGSKDLIQQAAKECPLTFVENSAARTELNRLP